MRIIDRYLLGQFLRTFVICYISLAGLFIVFDAFTNLEEFMNNSDGAVGLFKLLGSFYGYQSIMFFDRTAGLLTLTAATFTISWFQRNNEMTALLAAGVSRIRMVTPILLAGVAIAVFSAANRELIVPRFRREMARRPQDLATDQGKAIERSYDNQTDIHLGGKLAYADQQRIEKPQFLLPRDLDHFARQVTAENAYYKPPQEGRPGGYLFDKVTQPEDIAKRRTLKLGERPIVITPRDAPGWLEPNQCFVVSDVTFEQLTSGQKLRRFDSTAQLIAGLHNPSLDYGPSVRVAVHTRIVNPFMDLTLLFLGLPLVASRQSRNVFLAVGMCALVVACFLLVVIGCQYLGASVLLSPALAAWIPLIIFIPIAVWLSESLWR